MFHTVYIGIGSNFGDKAVYIERSLKAINSLPETEITALSTAYETKPYGVKEQGNFINLAARINTQLEPVELFRELKIIEKETGRNPRAKWHEREIDLDIILFDDIIFETEEITIPHREMERRDFVLIPLLEIAGDIVNPATGRRLSEIKIPDEDKVVLKKIDIKFNYK